MIDRLLSFFHVKHMSLLINFLHLLLMSETAYSLLIVYIRYSITYFCLTWVIVSSYQFVLE